MGDSTENMEESVHEDTEPTEKIVESTEKIVESTVSEETKQSDNEEIESTATIKESETTEPVVESKDKETEETETATIVKSKNKENEQPEKTQTETILGAKDKESEAPKITDDKSTENAEELPTEGSKEIAHEEIPVVKSEHKIGTIRLVPLSMLIDTSKPKDNINKESVTTYKSNRPVRNRKTIITIDSSSSDDSIIEVPIAKKAKISSDHVSSSSNVGTAKKTRAKNIRDSSESDVTTSRSKAKSSKHQKKSRNSSSDDDDDSGKENTNSSRTSEEVSKNNTTVQIDPIVRKQFQRKCRVRVKKTDISKYVNNGNSSKKVSKKIDKQSNLEEEKSDSESRIPKGLDNETISEGEELPDSESRLSKKLNEESETNKNKINNDEELDTDKDKIDNSEKENIENEEPATPSPPLDDVNSNTEKKTSDSDSEDPPIARMRPTRKGRKPVAKSNSDSDSDSGEDKNKNSSAESSASDVEANNKDGSSSDSSESEVFQLKKKVRVFKKSSNSSGSDEESDKSDKKKKKRKRIAESSDSDDDNDSPRKRKNIRKLIKTKDLDDETKRAAKEEELRKKRIEERQKLYNVIYEKPESVELSELILDFDEDTKEPLLKVDSGLMKLLKPHQATGVKFMWEACYETLKDCNEKPGSGCILAHCMGLGKTLQIVTLTHTLLSNVKKTGVERALVITPLSTLTNWAREYHQWMKHCKKRNIEVYDMSKFKDKDTRSFKLEEWFEEGGVCIMGYDMYRIMSNPKTKGLKKKQREILQKSLVDPGPDIVICDEGHLLKNEKTSLSQAVTKMRTKRRIVLTGTPLQNNLKEYYCMIQFIKPNLLGTYKEYLNRFVNPITNGQYTDSTERDTRLMKHRSHILHKLLEGCIQRRDYSVLAPYLPTKHEYVVYVTCNEVQQKLYEFYMKTQREIFVEASGKGAKLFQDFQNLRRIWTHPMCLRVNSDSVIKKKMLKDDDSDGSIADFIDDDSDTASSSNDSTSESETSAKSAKRPAGRSTRNNKKSDSEDEVQIVQDGESSEPSEWWMKLISDEDLNNLYCSPKLVLLMTLIKDCEAIGDKMLVFSQSLQSLDVIEHFLSLIDQKSRGNEISGDVGEFSSRWVPDVDYFRLDGSKSVDSREAMCKKFNNKTNLRGRLFLISTRAGGLGINLVAANRVVIFDVSWNPSHDTQSIFRVYRFGQDKPCYIYRLIAMGTMEQKVYERQIMKQATAKRVIDEQQISRHYNQNDLLELYSYELQPAAPREIPILPKDRLFAELLSNHEKLIYKYHDHDSLLENEESEHLSEEERKAAWSEYEEEKTRPPAAQYGQRQTFGQFGNASGSVTSNKIFGFRTDILLQLLNMKVSIDNPMLTHEQVVRLVPAYLQRFYSEMNNGDPTLYKDLLDLHKTLEMPQGMYMNPLLFANQAVPNEHLGFTPMMPQQSRILPGTSETIEILDD